MNAIVLSGSSRSLCGLLTLERTCVCRRSSSPDRTLPLMYEDYIERGPGSDLGDFTGMPLNDEARAKALLYTSNLPSTMERQCLAQSALGRTVSTAGAADLERGRRGRPCDRVETWRRLPEGHHHDLDGRASCARPPTRCIPPPASRPGNGKATRLSARTTHVKTAWMRRGNGIPGSDQSTITASTSRGMTTC